MSKKPGGRLTVMVMLFYFTAFLLLALRNAVWQGYALALCVPAAIWGGTHILGKCFHIDTLLFSLTNFLCALGILILYDTNPVLAYHQVVYYGVGLVGMVICIYFMRAFRTIRHLGFVMIAVSFAFLALPLLIGRETYGAKNWIYFHGVSIQPSEFVKILLILILAWFMSRRQFIPWFLCAVGCLLFLMLQKDLGTALLYYGVSLLLFFASTANLPLTLLGLLGGGGAAVLYWNEEAFQQTTSNYVPDISFSIIDPQVHGLTLYETWMTSMRRTYNDPPGEIFDTNTRGIIDRMHTSMQRGFSRAYALVGVPGTGKTYIMEKFVRESKDAFVISLDSIDSPALVADIVSSIQQRNVIIMMDDVDKLLTLQPVRTVETTEGNTPSEAPAQETKTGKLIKMFADLRRVAPGGVDPKTGAVLKNYTVVATMNNPKLFNNAVIKRSGRFDEVIEIGLPHPSIYMKRLMGIQVKDDRTNYAAWRFRLLYRYMRFKRITLADVSNLYDIMRIHRAENRSRFGVKDMFYAIRCLSKNRSNADKEYAL